MNTITNNRISGLVGLLLSITTLFGLFGFANSVSADYVVPGCTSATLNGNVITNGAPTIVWFDWGPNGSLSYSTPSQTVYSDTTFSKQINGLTENSNYSFRAMAKNNNGTSTGETISFKTSSCGGGQPPATNLTCSLDSGATPAPHKINKGVKFEATGGNGSYSWNTDGGSTAGQFASQAWPSWSTPGVKHVSVSSGGQTANCTTVTIVDDYTPPPATNLTCSLDSGATPAPHKINKGVKFEATGGNGSYSWNTDGGSTAGQFASQAWPSWSTPGVKHVSVSSGGQTANCTTVTITNDYNPPQVCQDPAANNYHISYPCTYDNPPVNNTYIVTASAGQGGSISPSSRTVNAGNTANFTVNPNSGYSINSVTSTCGGNLSGNTFTTGPVRSNCSVYASFDQHQGQGPIVILNSNSSIVDSGESAVLYWSTINNPTSCVASGGWSGNKNTSGGNQSTGALYGNTTFTLTCTNAYGSDNASTTVTITNDNNGDGPDVTTRSATNINDNDAVLNGTVDGNGISTRAWFEYGTSRSLGYSTSRTSYGSGSESYDERISGLNEDTTYYFRAVAENSEGIAYGSILSFRTDDNNNDDNNDEPDVTTKDATNVDSNSATLNGRVDGNGISTRAWFEYGTSRSLGYSTSRTSYGSGSNSYDKGISGLIPNTTYYFRAVAENSEGTARGSILSFYTSNGYNPPSNNQPTVVIYADSTNVAYNGATSIRWGTVNAASCYASGGSTGWAGQKSIGPASFYTGSLTGTRTYTITCTNNFGSDTDSVTVNVRGRIINPPTPVPTSYVVINSSVDRNQPIIPTLDNTNPRPGDEITYTVTYQNIGNASITGLSLRLDLPHEVDYMFSTPSNPSRSGNTLIFNLGTLKANAQGTVTVRVRVRDDIAPGTYLNFPAILSYIDPSGYPQSVNANVSAQIWREPVTVIEDTTVKLGANAFWAGFFPTNLFGWLLLLVLILILVYLAKYLFGQPIQQSFVTKKTTTTTVEH